MTVRPRRIVAASLAIGSVATVISVGLQGSDAYDTPLADLRNTELWLRGLGTAYGRTAIVALVAMALAGWSLDVTPMARKLAAGAWLLTGAAFAASGHASSAEPLWLARPLVFVHGLSMVFWIGSLPPLAAALLRPAGAVELQRFSRFIPLSIVALVLSGVILAALQLRSAAALWTTAYGLVLACKLALVTVLLGVGAFNRFALTPRIAVGDSNAIATMRRTIVLEIGIAVAILALVAAWRFTPPPRSLQAAASAPVHAHIHAGKAMADIRIERQGDGGRLFHLTLLDGQFGPLEAREVVLLLSKPDTGVERVRYPARHSEATIWRIPNVKLPVGGRWQARVEILIDDFQKIGIEGEIDLPR